MSRKKVRSKHDVVLEVPEDRDFAMFKLWITGRSKESIATEFGLHPTTVYDIAKKKNWNGYKAKLEDRTYKQAIRAMKSNTSRVIDMLAKDLERLYTDAEKEKRQLTKDERAYALSMLDRYLKENRLEDNKPTEIAGGTVVQEIHMKLPPGVSADQYGLIPPDKNVKMIETKETDEIKEEINLDDIEG